MMVIRSLADFNGTPWAVQVTVGAITVTAQATSSPDRHDTQGSGDFYLAISGDLQLAKNGDFHMATDSSDRGFHRATIAWIISIIHETDSPACLSRLARQPLEIAEHAVRRFERWCVTDGPAGTSNVRDAPSLVEAAVGPRRRIVEDPGPSTRRARAQGPMSAILYAQFGGCPRPVT